MLKLFPSLEFDPIESAVSYAARLAALHTGAGLVPFLRDIGIQPMHLARGDLAAILRVAEVADVDPDPIIENTPLSLGRRSYDLRGHIVSSEFLSNPATNFCPACLAEDDMHGGNPAVTRKGHWSWAISVMRTCSVHGISMVRRSKTAWADELHEMAVRVPERQADLHALIEVSPVRKPSALQAYAIERLDGRAGPGWLDAQSLDQAVRATEMIGMVLTFGADKNLSTATQDEWDLAGGEGFTFTSRGEDGIREALKLVHASCDLTTTKPGPQKVFGRLYQWLAYSKSGKPLGDVNRIVREHIFDTMEMPAGKTILGGELSQRRLHTVGTLAKETGLDSRTLRNVLAARGLISSDREAGLHDAFSAEEGREIASAMKRLVNVISLPKALNCTRPQADKLLDERLLLTLADLGLDVPGRTQKAVHEDQVQKLLEALSGAARSTSEVSAKMVPIAKAAEKAKVPTVEIVHLILGGFLKEVIQLEGEMGLAAILVDPAEVRDVLPKVMMGISASETAGRLRIPVQSVWALAEEALPKLEIHGPKPQHRIVRFDRAAVEDFRAAYITPVRLAEDHAVERKVVLGKLKRANLRPEFSWCQFGVDLYRVDQLPKSLVA